MFVVKKKAQKKNKSLFDIVTKLGIQGSVLLGCKLLYHFLNKSEATA
jgi:hypothetical protein